jgi:hypothetical protein
LNATNLIDAAFDVCTALDSVGILAVLNAPEAYQSDDIDFVLVFVPDRSPAEAVLAKIGFLRHPKEQYYARNVVMVEFPRGPLAQPPSLQRIKTP